MGALGRRAERSKRRCAGEPLDQEPAVFKDLANGNVYDFIYVPGKGVEIYKNGQLASTIQGLDFKKAMFGIWLCDKPAQESLKEAMLGQ